MRANTEARMREIAAEEGFRIRGLVLEALGAAGLQIQERECYKDFRPIRVSWEALNRVLTADDVREIVSEEIDRAMVEQDAAHRRADTADRAAYMQAERASAIASVIADLKVERLEQRVVSVVPEDRRDAVADGSDDICNELVLSIQQDADGDRVRLDFPVLRGKLRVLFGDADE